MSRTKRNYRIKTFEKLEGLGLSNEKEILNMKVNELKSLIPFSVKDVLNIIEMQEVDLGQVLRHIFLRIYIYFSSFAWELL